MKSVLLVEDEPALQLGIRDNLEFEGFVVTVAADGEAALETLRQQKFDLILLDVMLPRLSGFDVCRHIRTQGIRTPIIMLTARGEEIDKVLGLELGADDYVTKPFGVRELIARINALLRRTVPEEKPRELTLGRLSISFEKYRAAEKGEEVKLSHKEFQILQYLFQHKNEVVSRYDLLEQVWGYEEKPTTRTVDNFIVRLRQKIERDPAHPEVILTVHGTGYTLIA